MKPILMYRRTLDVRSGVGQLMHGLALGLRAAGAQVRLACHRGRWRFFARTGQLPRGLTRHGVRALNERDARFVIDHEMEVPGTAMVFAHGLISEMIRTQSRSDWSELLAREQRFFRDLNTSAPIVTCSRLMKTALVEHYAIDAERIHVHYPGCRREVFDTRRVPALRREARRKLGLDDATPLVGFVTSGDLQTRGIDIFLGAARRIHAVEPQTRFLVVGSRRLPESVGGDPLVAAGQVRHRPKSGRPELWMSALDLFLYPSRFDAFGIVIAEAQALGIPVLTSRRVGAAECLPQSYVPWLSDTPDGETLAAHALRLLGDVAARRELSRTGIERSADSSRERYVSECVATILAQNV